MSSNENSIRSNSIRSNRSNISLEIINKTDGIKESIIMEKLNARPKQNFSAILNCPTDNVK